jgi:nicotinate phosphoribosyltransferase
MTEPIITSLLDTDLYKNTMQQAVFHKYPDAHVKYKYKLRNYPSSMLIPLVENIIKEITNLCKLKYKSDELEYLSKLPYFTTDYIEYLKDFKLCANYIYMTTTEDTFNLTITGPWKEAILFETPVLAIISELFSREYDKAFYSPNQMTVEKIMEKKLSPLKEYPDIKIVEFGTRRRYSKQYHEWMLKYMQREYPSNLMGTSNIMFAKELGLEPKGTMAHEWFQAHQAFVPIVNSQKEALQVWMSEYGRQLSIALSDTFGMKRFWLRDFDYEMMAKYSGTREDSGDPYAYGALALSQYIKLGINPQTKNIGFTDGLNIKKVIDLWKEFNRSIPVWFGIGTFLTNELPGFIAPQEVIKMVECNMKPVVKISDSPGKVMSTDDSHLAFVRAMLELDKL